jgi:hypothetical protein
MRVTLVIAFVFSVAALFFSLLIYIQYRRAGTPLPDYHIGGIVGSVGLLLLVAGGSTLFNETVSMILTFLAGLLTIFSAVTTYRARRRMRRGRS